MAQNNSSIFSDVSTCLRDAMENMFNNGHGFITPENSNRNLDMSNNSGSPSAEALKSMMNKRQLALTGVINDEDIHQENGNGSAKRLCTMNGHANEQKT